jgi:pSer/pThr/pTyr-binding forkhead associated (FHA) protein
MQHRRDLSLNHPALIPIAGNYDKKARSLDREVTTIGRARGSDLCLEANEISTLHCLIYRTSDGYRIRDCNSRCGTRVNGDSVKTHLLHDTDIVNLGPFSFEFRLPAALFPKDGAKLDPVKVEHMRRSRRKLGQLALKMRKRQQSGSPREQEWVQKANLLKDKIRSYDQRLNELEEAEKELADERQQLEREAEQQRRRGQDVETKLVERLAQADEDIRLKWQEFQQRCHAEETRAIAASPAEKTSSQEPSEVVHQLQLDLNHKREQLHKLEDQWSRQKEQWQREQQEFSTMKQQWVKDQAKTTADMEEQQMTLAEKESAIRAQKAELLRMMGDIKKMQEDLRKQAKPDIRALHDEVERLKRENTELREHSPKADDGPELMAMLEENVRLRRELEGRNNSMVDDDIVKQIDDLRAEIALLSEELQNKEQIIQEFQQHQAGLSRDSEFGAELEQLRAENGLLKQLLEEKDSSAEPAEPHIPQPPKGEDDLERYENELNEYRRQLDTDRDKLNREVGSLRERNKELDEAIREMEMEMSKERAELARERMRLERVREEVKNDMERLQRELAVRDSMAPVQKLRDEITQKKAAANGKADKPVNDRLRTIRDLSNGS